MTKRNQSERLPVSERKKLKQLLALQDRKLPEMTQLLNNAKQRLPQLKKLLEETSGHWGYEDGIYRFYHQSFKVYWRLQPKTEQIVKELQALAPHLPLNDYFLEIIAEGTGKTWHISHNKNWPKHTRPIVEAFFHSRHMLAMVCKYAEELKDPPQMLPSGWATVLELYNLR